MRKVELTSCAQTRLASAGHAAFIFAAPVDVAVRGAGAVGC